MCEKTCLECGQPFAPQRTGGQFCGSGCRKAFNNRRMLRGAELYDLFMAMRFERETAKQEEVWTFLCRMASDYKARDDEERAGRRSWDTVRRVKARNVPLTAVSLPNYRPRARARA